MVALAAAFFALGAAVAKGASADGIAEGERFRFVHWNIGPKNNYQCNALFTRFPCVRYEVVNYEVRRLRPETQRPSHLRLQSCDEEGIFERQIKKGPRKQWTE